MTCDCCGAKKKLFEMFYSMGEGPEKIQLCSDCREVVEHLRTDRINEEMELYGIHQFQLRKRAKRPSQAFLVWKETHYPD